METADIISNLLAAFALIFAIWQFWLRGKDREKTLRLEYRVNQLTVGLNAKLEHLRKANELTGRLHQLVVEIWYSNSIELRYASALRPIQTELGVLAVMLEDDRLNTLVEPTFRTQKGKITFNSRLVSGAKWELRGLIFQTASHRFVTKPGIS